MVYSELTDVPNDPLIGSYVTESHLMSADIFINNELAYRNFDKNKIALPNQLLTQIAVNYAVYIALVQNSSGEDDLMLKKSTSYKQIYSNLLTSLNSTSLGLQTDNSSGGFGQFTIGRA